MKPARHNVEDLIGMRIVMMPPHPWAGYSGVIFDVINTPWGDRPHVELDNGFRTFPHNPSEMKQIK